jgi:hypothetical protein
MMERDTIHISELYETMWEFVIQLISLLVFRWVIILLLELMLTLVKYGFPNVGDLGVLANIINLDPLFLDLEC